MTFALPPTTLRGVVERDRAERHLRSGKAKIEISAPTPRGGAAVRPAGKLPNVKSIQRAIVSDGARNLREVLP